MEMKSSSYGMSANSEKIDSRPMVVDSKEREPIFRSGMNELRDVMEDVRRLASGLFLESERLITLSPEISDGLVHERIDECRKAISNKLDSIKDMAESEMQIKRIVWMLKDACEDIGSSINNIRKFI